MDRYSGLTEAFPPPGTVVSVRAYLIFRHRGVVTDEWQDGKPTVISNSPGLGAVEQPWDDFRSGQEVERDGYPGSLPYWEVLARARSQLGAPYRVFDSNCDHLKNFAHGLPVRSEQAMVTLGVTLAAAIALAMLRKK